MLNDLFRNYKKIILLIVLLLCAIFFWFFACHDQGPADRDPVSWEEETFGEGTGSRYRFSCSGLEGTVTFGAKGVVPPGKISPVRINARAGADGFKGTVRICLPAYDGRSIVYQSDLLCGKNKSLDWKMDIPQMGNSAFFGFEILDSYGSRLLSRTLKSDWASKENTSQVLYLGILCDNSRRLSYLDGMELGEEENGCILRLVSYRADDFPVDRAELEALSGILIDHFDTSRLQEKQVSCLEDYLNRGGKVLVGTGESGRETLSGLGDLLGLDDGKKEEEVLDFSGAVSASSRVNLLLDHVLAQKGSGWSQVHTASASSAWERKMEEGKAYYIAYSLSDKAFSSWSKARAAAKGLMEYILDQEGLFLGNDQEMLRMWYLERSLYSFMPSAAPDIFYYGSFFLIYIGALLLIGYYLLRRIGRREWVWLLVPLISAAFAAFLTLNSGRLSRPDSNLFSMLRISENTKSTDSCYVLYQNGKGEACRIDFSPNVNMVAPLDYEYRLDAGDSAEAGSDKIDYSINYNKRGYDVSFSEAIPGTSRLLFIDTDKKSGGGLKGDIHTLPTSFYGTIRNDSGKNYERILIIRGRQYLLLPGLEEGEQMNLDGDLVRCLSNYEEDPFSLTLETEEADEDSAMANVLFYAGASWMKDSDHLDETILAGICSSPDSAIFDDEDEPSNQINLDIVHLEDQNQDENDTKTFTISNINAFCLRSDQEGLLAHDTLETNKTKATYQFDRSRVLRRLFRNRDSFAGSIRAYNYRTGKDDLILKKWDDCLEGRDLEDYLSDQNVMILTYQLPDGQDIGNTPILSADMADKKE